VNQNRFACVSAAVFYAFISEQTLTNEAIIFLDTSYVVALVGQVSCNVFLFLLNVC
jgi:hypothetical protein